MDFNEKGYGFIRAEKVMYFILFVLARVRQPVTRAELTELVMIDGGFDYFDFSDALSSLMKTGHAEEVFLELYEITEKGRTNGAIMEDQIAYSVRKKSEALLREFNIKKLGEQLNRTRLFKREDEPGYTAEMVMDDADGNLMTLSFFTANETHGKALLKKFEQNPATVYKDFIAYLMADEQKEE
jgi:hypothetical protein